MKAFALTFLLAFLSISARAETGSGLPYASLFFTPQQAHEANRLAEKQNPGAGDINLGAVIYGHGWALWLRNERWTPQTSRPDLRVLEVTTENVRLAWRGDDDAEEREITLKPNQSFQISTGKIIAGP